MTFIGIQAGHYRRTSGATGAPGEQDLNWRVTLKLSEILQSKGFVVQILGADPPSEEIDKDFDLFLALHGDADMYGEGGGCIAAPEPSTDSATKESYRIKDAIESVYFKESGIANHPNRVNKNMTYYYMWSQLSAKTPCVILEMGVVQDAHDKVILADTDRVAIAIAKGICKAFGVDYEPKPTDPIEPDQPSDPCKDLKDKVKTLELALSNAEKAHSDELAVKDARLIEILESYKQRLTDNITKVLENTQKEE